MAELEAKILIDQAMEATGLSDFGEDAWREGLDQLVASLNADAALNEIGVMVAEGEIVTYLSSRLGVVEERRVHPEIGNAPVVPPIVIVGQGRTGTTILFDLLA